MKASIVVMVYKNFESLIKTIESIVIQSYENYEVIISDDGSPNFEEKYFQDIKEKFNKVSKIKFIRNAKNQGTVKHFNQLIKNEVTGDIICPLSCGDEFFNKNSLQEIVDTFRMSNALVVSAKRCEVRNKTTKNLPLNYELNLLNQPQSALRYIMTHGSFISGASTYYHKKVFQKYGYFNEEYRLVEDLPFYIELLAHDEKIIPIKKPTIRYDLTGVSSSSGRNPILDKDYLKLDNSLLKRKDITLSFMNKRVLHYSIDKMKKKYSTIILHLLYIDRVVVYFIHMERKKRWMKKEKNDDC